MYNASNTYTKSPENRLYFIQENTAIITDIAGMAKIP